MKNQFLRLLAITLCFTCTQISHAEKIFHEIAKLPGVESAYIGKAMISMAGGCLNNIKSDVNIQMRRNELSNINSIEVINCDIKALQREDKNMLDRTKRLVQRVVKIKKLEVLMEQKSAESSTTIYGRLVTNNNVEEIHDMVIENCDAEEYQLIYIDGVSNPQNMNINMR